MKEARTAIVTGAGKRVGRAIAEALVADGVPVTSFAVDDVRAEYQRLRALGVHFTQEPTEMGAVTTAVLDDTCGNLIQLAQEHN